MIGKARRWWAPVVLGLGMCILAIDGSADQTDPRLNGLFEELRAATDQDSADRIEAQIWKIWLATPDSVTAANLKAARAAAAKGDYDTALAEAGKALHGAPTYAEAWNVHGTLLYETGDFQGSLADIEQTLKLEPRHFGALAGRGLCYMQMGDNVKALAAFEQALAIYPRQPVARVYADTLRREQSRAADNAGR